MICYTHTNTNKYMYKYMTICISILNKMYLNTFSKIHRDKKKKKVQIKHISIITLGWVREKSELQGYMQTFIFLQFWKLEVQDQGTSTVSA
jgi:hypothetical protein